MRDEELVDRLERCFVEFLVPLRMGDGFQEHAFKDLMRTLREFKQEWATEEVIPKRAAMQFADAYPAIEAAADLYGQKDSQVILQSAGELADEIRFCLEVH